MKMNVVDYLMLHGDRHSENFLINPNAAEGESTVTAIDNDMIMGVNGAGRAVGNTTSGDLLNGLNNNTAMDWGIKLGAVFPMMTPGVKKALADLDVAKFNEMLMPYADRVVRMGIVHRAKELKALAKKVPECDFSKEGALETFMQAIKKEYMIAWIKTMNVNDPEILLRMLPNQLVRMILQTYGTIDRASIFYRRPETLILSLKTLGFTKEEALQMLVDNLSSTKKADVKVTLDEVMASKFAAPLADYNLPEDEFREKYKLTTVLKVS